MQSTSSQIPCMYHNHKQVQCLGSSFIKLSSCTKMPAFLPIIFLGYNEASWTHSLGFIIFSYSRSWVCLNSDKKARLAQIRRVTTLWINVWMYSTLVLHQICGWALTRLVQTRSLLCMEGAIWHFPPAVWLH